MRQRSGLRRLWRRIRFGPPIVVVSGLPRSGTSMIMKMLEAGGLPIVSDGVRTADEDNPRGYFEDERVKVLATSDPSWLSGARGKAVKVISHLLKDLPPRHNYLVLFVRRDIGEVLASQARMLERRGQPKGPGDERIGPLLERDLWQARRLIGQRAEFDVLELHYADVVAHPAAQALRIVQFLGRPLDAGAMAAVVDSSLYRNRATSTSGTASGTPPRP